MSTAMGGQEKHAAQRHRHRPYVIVLLLFLHSLSTIKSGRDQTGLPTHPPNGPTHTVLLPILYPPTYPPTYPLTHDPPTYLPTHPLTYLPTHPSTHIRYTLKSLTQTFFAHSCTCSTGGEAGPMTLGFVPRTSSINPPKFMRDPCPVV